MLAQVIDPTNANLQSVGGIIIVSFILTEVVKKLVTPTTPFFGKIPVILIPLIFTSVLTILCNKIAKTNDGQPFLKGNIWVLLTTAIGSASSASGIYSWLRNPAATTGDSKSILSSNTGEDNIMKPNILIWLLVPTILFVNGCQNGTTKAPDPTVQLTMAEDFYVATENVLTAAEQAHLIPTSDVQAIIATRNTARDILATAKLNVDSNPSQFQAAMSQFATVSADLVKYRSLYTK